MTPERSAPSIWMRPERAAVGRPAQHSRAEITAVAVDIADREGLDAVSMRRVAAELGTGAASLYRYVETREELLDLMTDATGAEYALPAPTGDWVADLVAVGEQSRAILRRHPWLPGLVMTRPVIGPNGIALLEHVLTVLENHPASLQAKMEAFAMLNGLTATSVLYELAGGSDLQARNVAYLQYAIASGEHLRLAALLSQQPGPPTEPTDPADSYSDILARVLTGLLGHHPQGPGA
jgi:AcrR family transcriptional regulator